jgi:hypothetical protein
MIIEKYRDDAESLVSAVPTDLPVSYRLNHLTQNVFQYGKEVYPDMLDYASTFCTDKETFYVVERESLDETDSELGELSRSLKGLAFVACAKTLPSVLVLPKHDSTKTLANGLILTHELEHITEKNEGLFGASIGVRERRAYSTNIATAAAIDGTDFTNYINNWPLTYTRANGSVDISFHDIDCPEPPKDTFVHDVWREGESSRIFLQSMGRAAAFEAVTSDLPVNVANELADGLHT